MKVSTPSVFRLNAKVAASWDAVLPRGPRVLVPVQLDVLVVRQPGGTWARTAMTVPQTADASARQLAAPPFAELDAPRPAGAYLHWAPPDALAHGRQRGTDGDEATEFPALPDRWLVLRVSAGATPNTRAVTGWVLRAGDEVPVAIPLDEWRGGDVRRGEVEAPLTVLGHGDPAFVAYFDNVTNRLAFYDDMQGVRPGAVAYQVSGWFADAALDPIAAADVRSVAAFEQRLDELGWRTPALDLAEPVRDLRRLHAAASLAGLQVEQASVELAWPTQTLYHGSAVGIGWPRASDGGATEEIGGPPPPGAIDVVIGASPGSAVATLVASRTDAPAREPIIEAYYAGALAELEQADARARIDARLHRLEFAPIAAGETTTWIWQADAPRPPRPPRPDHVDIGDVIATPTAMTGIAVARAPAPHAGAFMARADGLAGVLTKTDPVQPPDAAAGGHYVQVRRALPRFFRPTEPSLLISGAHRSERHGGDGRFTQDGRLACRLSGGVVRRMQARTGTALSASAGRVAVEGAALLERRIDNGSVPPECEALLDELVLLDPGSARAAALGALGLVRDDPRRAEEIAGLAHAFAVEQTAWWSTRDPAVDGQAIADHSGVVGVLPSPLAVTPPRRPWQPVHVDWRVEYLPSLDRSRDFTLDEIDYEPAADAAEPPAPVVIEGRTLLGDGVVRALSSRTRSTFARALAIGTARRIAPDHLPGFASDIARELLEAAQELRLADPSVDDPTREQDIADELAELDLLAGRLDTLHESIAAALGGDAPAMRGGWLRVVRLRLVDGFGQIVDLAGSSATTPVDPQRVRWSRQLRAPGVADRGLLRPRSLEPTRISLRYVDAAGGPDDAGIYGTTADRLRMVSPVCGYVLPNHLDASLAFFDASGAHLGAVRPGLAAPVVWEDAPGRPSLVGGAPRDAIANDALAAIATAIVAQDAIDPDTHESALAAVLRVIDTTRWASDPCSDGGDDRLGLLVGHPIVVMRARLRLEIDDPTAPRDPAERVRRARALPAVPVRLGALAQLQDGLLGYFVDDDTRRMRTPDPAAAELARPLGPGQGFLQRIDLVADYAARFADDLGGDASGATPVRHPFVDRSGVLWLQPEREVALTLLMEPHSRLHVTTGLLPRKDVGMRREWLDRGFSRLMPTFRFGPVLIDPQQVRMPVPRQVEGRWTWSHRVAIGRWDSPTVVEASPDAAVSDDPAVATEGWLELELPTPQERDR